MHLVPPQKRKAMQFFLGGGEERARGTQYTVVHSSVKLLIPAIISTVVPAGILQPPFFYANDIPR